MNIHDLISSAKLLQPRKAEIDGLGVVFFRRRTLVEQVEQDKAIAKHREAKKAGNDAEAASTLLAIVLADLCDESGKPQCATPEEVEAVAGQLSAPVAIDLIDAWNGAIQADAKN